MDKYMDKSLELELSSGYDLVCGTDEAGRGPLCGPVVAAACILPRDYDLPYLNDSKKLSEKRREELYELITQTAKWAVGMASPHEIDEYNILNASQLAMRRAVDSLDRTPQLVLIDGNVSRGFETATKTVVGGDRLCPSIAAASIIAKVTRDRLMKRLADDYPTLGLASHKGYPTKAHYAALREYITENGELPEIYRVSFLKKFTLRQD